MGDVGVIESQQGEQCVDLVERRAEDELEGCRIYCYRIQVNWAVELLGALGQRCWGLKK